MDIKKIVRWIEGKYKLHSSMFGAASTSISARYHEGYLQALRGVTDIIYEEMKVDTACAMSEIRGCREKETKNLEALHKQTGQPDPGGVGTDQ